MIGTEQSDMHFIIQNLFNHLIWLGIKKPRATANKMLNSNNNSVLGLYLRIAYCIPKQIYFWTPWARN